MMKWLTHVLFGVAMIGAPTPAAAQVSVEYTLMIGIASGPSQSRERSALAVEEDVQRAAIAIPLYAKVQERVEIQAFDRDGNLVAEIPNCGKCTTEAALVLNEEGFYDERVTVSQTRGGRVVLQLVNRNVRAAPAR